MATIGQAEILLTANTASFTSEMDRAREQTGRTFGDIKNQAADIGNKVKAGFAMASAAVAGMSTAVGVLVGDQMRLANELTKTARIANAAVGDIQKLAVAAETLGVEQDKLGDIYKDTQDKIGDFLTTGGGELKDFFDNIAPKINLTAESLRGLSGPDALQAVYNALDKANLSQSEMIFYMESIADEASLLIPLLKDNGKYAAMWGQILENTGAKMDEKTIRSTQELNAATKILTTSYQGVKNQIAQAFLPVLSDLAGAMAKDVTLKNQAATAGKVLAEGFKFIIATGLGVVGIFRLIGTGAGALAAAIANPLQALDILKTAWADMGGIITGVNKAMNTVFNAGTGGQTNQIVVQVANATSASQKLNAALGQTGQQYQATLETQKQLNKEREKAAKIEARLVGISGDTGIGSGAHLDIRASGGGRRLTAAELARFEANGKPLTAYPKTSDYGYRGNIGVAGASKYHRGIDFAMPVGTPITTKVPVKSVSNFYDSKGGGYVQRIVFADGLSVDLLHQSAASKNIKGGSSGLDTPYAKAQDEANQLIAQQQNEAQREAEQLAKQQADLRAKIDYEQSSERTKLYMDFLKKEKEITDANYGAGAKQRIEYERQVYLDKVAKLDLERDKALQNANAVHQTEVERIKAEAELERREVNLTVKNDEALRLAKIDAINQAEQAAMQKATDSFKRELDSITGYAKSEIQKIRDESAIRLAGINGRTDINEAQKATLREALAGQTANAIRLYQQPKADAFNALNAEMSGTSELQNLQNQLNQRLEIIKQAKDAEVIATEQAEAAKAQIERQYQISRYDMMMSSGQQILGGVTSSLKATLGEHSKAYRVMFAIEKGVNIARSLMAINTGIAMAAANPFPMNLGAMVSVAAATASIVSDLMAIKNPVGQAHDGIMSVPESGTWNLQKGERVLPEYTAKRLDKTLDDVSKGTGGGVNIVFENHTNATIRQVPSQTGELRFAIQAEIDTYVPQQLSKTNSPISQALLQNTTATRRL